MAVFYLDSSAALKRQKTEKGTDVVNELYAGLKESDTLLTSHFTCLEVESVAARALKGGVLNDEAYGKMLAAFASDLDNYLTIVGLLGSGFINDAIEMAQLYALRPGDAIHLSVAESVPTPSLIFVASDVELIYASQSAGFLTLDPEAEKAMELLRDLRK